jgi:hypothetical protein
MDNPETLATLGSQDTGQRQTKQKNTTQKTKKMSNTDTTKNTTQKTKKMSNTDTTKNTTQKTKKMSNTDTTKTSGEPMIMDVLAKAKQFMPLIRHSPLIITWRFMYQSHTDRLALTLRCKLSVQWNLYNPTPVFSRHPVTSDKNAWSQTISAN